MTKEQRQALQYKRAVMLLGQLEDKIGYTPEFERYERQVGSAQEYGHSLSFVINSMTKKLDELAND